MISLCYFNLWILIHLLVCINIINRVLFLEGNAVVMRLFGVTDRGNSVAVCVFGYRPYFFASVPPSFGAQHIQKTIELLNSHIKVLIKTC